MKFLFAFFIEYRPRIISKLFIHENVVFIEIIPFLLANEFTKVAFQYIYIVLCKTFWGILSCWLWASCWYSINHDENGLTCQGFITVALPAVS